MTVTLVWRSDVHMADKAPESRTDDWPTTVLDKLRQVGEIAREVGADAVIDGGDFFHIKTPSRTSHELVQRIAGVHRAYPCPVYVLTGNHDVKYGDPAFLRESPLGVLIQTGVFRPFGDAEELRFGNVRVVGVPYHGKEYDRNRLTTIVKGDEQHLFVAAHLLASQAGGEMFGAEDIIRYGDLLNLDPATWAFGHWHKDQGIYEAGGKTIINIGSLTRGALSEDEINRKPAVAILRFNATDRSVERRDLVVKPASEVFDLVGRVRQEARKMTIEAFVESVRATLDQPNRLPLLEEVRGMALPQGVRDRVVAYLESEGCS